MLTTEARASDFCPFRKHVYGGLLQCEEELHAYYLENRPFINLHICAATTKLVAATIVIIAMVT